MGLTGFRLLKLLELLRPWCWGSKTHFIWTGKGTDFRHVMPGANVRVCMAAPKRCLFSIQRVKRKVKCSLIIHLNFCSFFLLVMLSEWQLKKILLEHFPALSAVTGSQHFFCWKLNGLDSNFKYPNTYIKKSFIFNWWFLITFPDPQHWI